MKRTLLILVVIIVSASIGYWFGQSKTIAEVNGNTPTIDEENVDSDFINSDIEDFDVFIYRFISDSLFQLGRIQFPLRSSRQIDIETVDTIAIKKADWKIHRLFLTDEFKAQLYDNFNGELRDTNERMFCWEGIENGIYIEYKFKRVNGNWCLIEYNDFSD